VLREILPKFERNYQKIEDGFLYVSCGLPNKRLFLQFLEERLTEGYTFVILDPIADCVPLLNANDYIQVNAALKPLRSLATKYNPHILCVHHANRQGSGSNAFLGSQAFRAFSDTNMWIEGTEQEPRFLSSENRMPLQIGGLNFEGVHLLMNKDDGSVTIGTRKMLTDK